MPKPKKTATRTVSHGWKYRIYPTKEQQMRFELAFAACDYVYDQLLDDANRYYAKFAKSFDDKIKRILQTPDLDKDGNQKISVKTGRPITKTRKIEQCSADEKKQIKALKKQRKFLGIRTQQFVTRIVPSSLDRNGDPWLSYVTKQADGSDLPDWITPRRLTKNPVAGIEDPDGVRFLAIASIATNDAVNRLNTAFKNLWKGKGRVKWPQLKVSKKERRNIRRRIAEANPRSLYATEFHWLTRNQPWFNPKNRSYRNISDREVYQEAAKTGTHSFGFQVKKSDVLDMFADDAMKRISLPGIPGTVKIRTHRIPSGLCTHATISRDTDGKWFLALTCTDIALPQPSTPANHDVACEIGIREYLVLSDGTKIGHPAQLKALQKRIDEEKAKLSRKRGGHVEPKLDENNQPVRYKSGKKKGQVKTYHPARSKGYRRQKAVVDRLEAKQRRIRQHNIHLTTAWLTDNYEQLYIRNNNVKGMLENERTKLKAQLESGEITEAQAQASREMLRDFERNLHRALADSSFFEFRRQMEYKSDWKCREILVADTDLPTTQTCSVCGYKNEDLAGIKGLSIRQWDCPECGAHHHREENSARNIYDWAHNAFAGTVQ